MYHYIVTTSGNGTNVNEAPAALGRSLFLKCGKSSVRNKENNRELITVASLECQGV